MRRLAMLLCLLLAQPAFAGLRDVDFDPHPGARVPLDLLVREGDRKVRLDRYFGAVPVVLQLGYLGCLNLCSTTLVGADEVLSRTGLEPGRDYVALFLSIDPRDERAPPEERPGWHMLTGASSAAAVAKAVGFRYAYDKDSGEFAHPAGFVLLTPEGAVADYFPGVRFDAQRLRAAIADAQRGRTAGTFERLLLLCFHDPQLAKHTPAVLDALRIAMAAFLALLGVFAWRHRR